MKEELTLDAGACALLLQAAFAVAAVDGVQPDEIALLLQCHEGFKDEFGAGIKSFEAIRGETLDLSTLAAAFDSDMKRGMLANLCLVTAYADGSYSAAEAAAIREITAAAGMTAAALGAIEAAVKEDAIGRFADLSNVELVTEVAKSLDRR